MPGQFESPRSQNSEAVSTIKKIVRPDGVKQVELVTRTGKYSIMLRDDEPYIASSTDTMNFGNLSPSDQRLVDKALREQE